MATAREISIPLLPGQLYHIFNRGNEQRSIFFKEDNFQYFLNKLWHKTKGFFHFYAYCLLDNHFHLLVKVASVPEIIHRAKEVRFSRVDAGFYRRYVERNPNLTVLSKGDSTYSRKIDDFINKEELSKLKPLSFTQHPTSLENLPFLYQLGSYIVTQQLRRFFLGYSKAINKQQKRTGSLFQKPFRRKWVPDAEYAKTALAYILHNPIHHGYVLDYEDYPCSSFDTYFTDSSTLISRDEVFSWFSGSDNFREFLQNYKSQKS